MPQTIMLYMDSSGSVIYMNANAVAETKLRSKYKLIVVPYISQSRDINWMYIIWIYVLKKWWEIYVRFK